MKLGAFLFIMFSLLLNPFAVSADENVTEGAVTEGAVTESAVVVDLDIREYLRENVFTTEFFATVSGLGMFVLLGLAKGFLTSNKKFSGQVANIKNLGGAIETIKNETHETYEGIKAVMSENSFLKRKMEKLEKTEEFIVATLKDFIRATNIRVDDKLDIAKKFDSFNSMINYIEKNDIEISDDIVKEFKEAVTKSTEEDVKKTDDYIKMLKSVSDEHIR